jgi:ABC-type transporter Mla MlaB component
MARSKDFNWTLPDTHHTYDSASLAVLMDLRDELKRLNNLLNCPNALEIPTILRKIRANTTKKRKKRRA